jgi:hypothetical protein
MIRMMKRRLNLNKGCTSECRLFYDETSLYDLSTRVEFSVNHFYKPRGRIRAFCCRHCSTTQLFFTLGYSAQYHFELCISQQHLL